MGNVRNEPDNETNNGASMDAARRALYIASVSELTAEALAEFSGAKRKVALRVYSRFTELFVTLVIVLSVGLTLYEISSASASGHEAIGALQTSGREVWGRHFNLMFALDIGFSCFFLVEYLVRIWLAPDKWLFVRRHVIDLLALLPLLRIFRFGRLFRLFRILRVLRVLRTSSFIGSIEDFGGDLAQRASQKIAVVVYLGFAVAFGTVGILTFERGHDSGFESFGDAAWWALVTVTTVGYGDRFPVTPGGRMIASIVMVVGLSFYAVLTGMLSSSLIERASQRRKGLMDISHFRNHVIVCGWNPAARSLLHDLVAAEDASAVIVVTDEDLSQEELPSPVRWLRGDYTRLDVLRKAGMSYARSAMVLAERRDTLTEQDVDARTILTAMTIERANEGVHTIAELLVEDNREHADRAGIDEVVVTGSIGETVLNRVAAQPGYSLALHTLLELKDVTFNVTRLPDDLVGESADALLTDAASTDAGIPWGIRRGDQTFSIRTLPGALQSDDHILRLRP